MAEGRWPMTRLVAWVQWGKAALRREEGQTLLEYALVIAFIVVATIPFLPLLVPAIGRHFDLVTQVIGEHSPL